MKRTWSFTILALMMVLAFGLGCAKKTVLKEESAPKESAVAAAARPVVRTPEKRTVTEEAMRKRAEAERKRAEAEKAAREQQARKAQAGKTSPQARKEPQAKTAPAKDIYEVTDIHFDFDRYNLKDEVRATLNKHAEWLKKNRNVAITVEGHADERGTAEYNLALGERRADAAAKYLADMGVDIGRIKTISYGFERPVDPRHNEDAWAKNRRDHFVVSGK